jgi:hypothetical protein
MGNPLHQSITLLKRGGYRATIVTKTDKDTRQPRPMLGFADILAYHARRGEIILVMVTEDARIGLSKARIAENPNANDFVKSGGKVFLHGWRRTKNGLKCAVVEILMKDFPVDKPNWRPSRVVTPSEAEVRLPKEQSWKRKQMRAALNGRTNPTVKVSMGTIADAVEETEHRQKTSGGQN